MKMVLTGMLIYIPSESRAGVATLVCVIACCNLNYFEPHKNKLLFWLSQISFVTTTFKYVVALLLSDNVSLNAQGVDEREQRTISVILITLDIFFMVSSLFAVLASVCVLFAQMKKLRRQKTDAEIASSKVVPSGGGHQRRKSSYEKAGELRDIRRKFGASSKEYQAAVQKAQEAPLTNPDAPDKQNFSESHDNSSWALSANEIVDTLHEEHRLSQMGLEQNMRSKQMKQRRNTQVRLEARAKLKKMKTMSKIAAFQFLSQEQIEIMIDTMILEKHSLGEALTEQGEPASKFYIIMEGECAAYVATNYASDLKVGVIPTFSFFGEHSLLAYSGKTEKCNATVRVESDFASLLVLNKKDFVEMIENGTLDHGIWKMLDSVKKIDLERQSENSAAISKQSEF
jgi:hypothetical protein